MQSISKRQQIVSNSGFIDLNSSSQDNFKVFSGDAMAIALYNVAAEFITKASQNLNAVDRNAGGQLEKSIIPTDIIIMGKVMTININVLDYYKFVDKGVKGWKTGSPSDSPFKFQLPGKRGSAPKNSKMVAAIKTWLMSEASKNTGKENKHAVSKRGARRNKITDTSTSAAILATMMIKRKGLKKTNFWGKTEAQATTYAQKEFENALYIDINNSFYGNSNK